MAKSGELDESKEDKPRGDSRREIGIMIEQKVGRTSVFYLRLQIMNPWKWQAQTEAVRSSISLGTIHWLKLAACFRVTSNGGGWKVVRKREWRGRKEMSLFEEACGHLFRREARKTGIYTRKIRTKMFTQMSLSSHHFLRAKKFLNP